MEDDQNPTQSTNEPKAIMDVQPPDRSAPTASTPVPEPADLQSHQIVIDEGQITPVEQVSAPEPAIVNQADGSQLEANESVKTELPPEDTEAPLASPLVSEDNQAEEIPENPEDNNFDDPSQPEKDAETPPEANSLMAAKPSQPTNKKPRLVIIMAILVMVALIGFAVFAFMSSRQAKDQTPNTANQTEAKTNDSSGRITTGDLDKVIEEVDKSVDQADDAKDFPESSMTDQSLGIQ